MELLEIKSNLGNTIKGPLLVKPKVYRDERGYFYESWNNKEFNRLISRDVFFVQDNHSKSSQGVLRGLHFQTKPKPQAKLVRCTNGSIYDVVVDIRENSSTFGEWFGVFLDQNNKLQFWIPEGFAHGFLSIKDDTEVQYKTNEYWDKSFERSLNWNDKEINISWPIKDGNKKLNIITTGKDSLALNLRDLKVKGDLFN